MIKLVALDETGTFEFSKNDVVLIGGVFGLFKDESEIKSSKKRIVGCLRKMCEKFNCEFASKYGGKRVVYPNSFHMSDMKRINSSNKIVVLSKSQSDAFVKFLRESFEGILSENKLEVYALYYPYNKSEYIYDDQKDTSNLIRYDSGENFYERMAVLTMYNHVFYSTSPEPDAYSFHFAARTVPTRVAGPGINKTAEIKHKGEYAIVTNTNFYKEALVTMLYEKDLRFRSKEYSFSVSSINYEDAELSDVFHILSDIACSFIRKDIEGIKTKNGSGRLSAKDLCDYCEKSKYSVRLYSLAEEIYKKMVEAIKRNDVFSYFEGEYDLIHCADDYRVFYLQEWMPKVKLVLKGFVEQCSIRGSDNRKMILGSLDRYIVLINEYMGKRQYDYEKGLRISESIESFYREIIGDDELSVELQGCMFDLYDLILRGFNHRGDTIKVREMAEKCEVYRSCVSAERYVSHSLRVVQIDFNMFDYKKALDRLTSLLNAAEMLGKSYDILYNTAIEISSDADAIQESQKNGKYGLIGKIYSSVGQAYAFLEQNDTANEYFRKALQQFDIGSADRGITLSYYLHSLIEMGDKVNYELVASEYFGVKEIKKQCECVIEHCRTNEYNSFDMFVFVKAYKKFYAKDSNNKQVYDRIDSCFHEPHADSFHPWELIYKNMYEIARDIFCDEHGARFYFEKTMSCIKTKKRRDTLHMIILGVKVDYFRMSLSELVGNKLNKLEIEMLQRHFPDIFDENKSINDLKECLSRILTYMYR